ncbi:fumarylacetoacetate hydrolase family protein [Microbacterium sp. BK668]|uniref:fumarylacetoacetate hydrolase family protein n=1 Tax=Microbacterium sp. BK668 TaxID=2512118 RepID=UPI00105F6517|nr:fumarylacetoacetate hydrolase family protein [Microbacterium sp. BK668]TDN92374.1 2-keto-4-pentenoate hydratase/2-oxohepta-3-ene-1,7-dioic acid hydratase in catechol pathway [Microbacterium sp. BK668]
MRIGRALVGGHERHVRQTSDGWVVVADPYAALAAGREPTDIGPHGDGQLLAPSAPVVVVGIAQNGPSHASPVQAWLKSPHGVTPSGRTVELRRDAGTTVAEGEIAVVIGRDTTGLTADSAHEYVLGVTAVNDLSSPERTALDPRNFESKSGVGYTPLGPWIDTDADIDSVALTLRVDGRRVAETDATALPCSIRDCLAYVARWSPLGPGDVVMTGAPFTAAPIEPGSVVEVQVGDVLLVTPTA